jgi:hypothetical protein
MDREAMIFVRPTTGISRADLARYCLQELGCGPDVQRSARSRPGPPWAIALRCMRSTMARPSKRLADRAFRCIEREKLREYHLKVAT